MDEEYEDEMEAESDDPASMLSEAFPDFTPDQIAALKEYIHSCIDEGPSKAKPKSKSKGKDGGLALIFGEE